MRWTLNKTFPIHLTRSPVGAFAASAAGASAVWVIFCRLIVIASCCQCHMCFCLILKNRHGTPTVATTLTSVLAKAFRHSFWVDIFGISKNTWLTLACTPPDKHCLTGSEEPPRKCEKLDAGTAAPAQRAQPPAEDVRRDLLTAAFEALNWTGTGQLSADEMRPFANETGFKGTDEEWKEEFKMLLQECGENAGITLPNFAKLVNDTSEDGCYCSNQGLRKLITSLEEARAETAWNDQLEPGDPKSFDKMHFAWI